MRTSNFLIKSLSAVVLLAVASVFSTASLAFERFSAGELMAVGQVTVNGVAVSSSTTLVSGSVVAVGANSSATLNLGKAGKLELMANSSANVSFSGNQIVAIMSSGKVRVMTSAGTSSTITTNHTTVLGDVAQTNSFVVEVECGHTHVDAFAGSVVMRTGSSDRTVAAGSSALAGNLSQTGCQPCYRPETPIATGSPATFMTVLLLAGGAIGTAFIIGARQSADTTGSVVVVSPIR
jgi:hypothetical protein